MKTIYWIETLGNIESLIVIALTFSVIIFLTAIILLVIQNAVNGNDYESADSKKATILCKKVIKKSYIVVCISSILAIFIPSKEALYRIYGIGGTIDYIKSNEKTKQLPDKVINALDKCLDNLSKEEKNGNI